VAAAAKIASMLPETVVLPSGGQGQAKATGGNFKTGACEPDKHDAAVIRCQTVSFPIKKPHFESIASAVAPIRVTGCNAQEEQTAPTKAWLTEPCVVTGGKFFVDNAVTIAAQAGSGTQAVSGSNITAPGAGNTVGTAPPKSSPAPQPGVNAPLNPGVGTGSGSGAAGLTGQLTSPGGAVTAPSVNQAADRGNFKAAPPPPSSPAAAVAASGQTATQAGNQGNFTAAPSPPPTPGSSASGGAATAASQAASKAGNSPGGWANSSGAGAAASQGWTGGSGSGQSEVDKQLEKAGCKPVAGQQKSYACSNPQALQICDGLKKQGKVNSCKPG
jgi:hypothetical protein